MTEKAKIKAAEILREFPGKFSDNGKWFHEETVYQAMEAFHQSKMVEETSIAIKFAEWIREMGYGYYSNRTNMWHSGGQSVHHEKNGFTTSQLFEMFKSENQ